MDLTELDDPCERAETRADYACLAAHGCSHLCIPARPTGTPVASRFLDAVILHAALQRLGYRPTIARVSLIHHEDARLVHGVFLLDGMPSSLVFFDDQGIGVVTLVVRRAVGLSVELVRFGALPMRHRAVRTRGGKERQSAGGSAGPRGNTTRKHAPGSASPTSHRAPWTRATSPTIDNPSPAPPSEATAPPPR